MGLFDEMGKFFTGTPEKYEQRSTLGKEQQPLYKQMLAASQGKGAGGAFGESADYYRDLLSDDSQTANAMFAPEMRRFNEQIVPDLAEQFAGMGSGGLSSSGFRNAAVGAGTDLSERLGSIRAQLRQQGAQGLSNLGNQSLQNYNEYYQSDPGSQGFLSQAAPLIGTAVGAFAGGPTGAAMGAQAANSMFGKSSPYGNQGQSGYQGSFGQLPKFGGR